MVVVCLLRLMCSWGYYCFVFVFVCIKLVVFFRFLLWVCVNFLSKGLVVGVRIVESVMRKVLV